jgi:hypothetical protein
LAGARVETGSEVTVDDLTVEQDEPGFAVVGNDIIDNSRFTRNKGCAVTVDGERVIVKKTLFINEE